MCTHIGMHITKEDILNETLVNKCGLCGGIAYSNTLKVSFSQGGDDFYKYVKQLPVQLTSKENLNFQYVANIPSSCRNVRYAKAIFGHMLVIFIKS